MFGFKTYATNKLAFLRPLFEYPWTRSQFVRKKPGIVP